MNINNKNQLIIIFLGPQGSGKGTQAEMLAQKFNLPVIETGKLFRRLAESETIKGNFIKRKIEQGKFISDQETISMLKDELKKINIQKGFILDGFPRNLNQAKFLEKFDNKAVIYLKISNNETIKRLSSRKTCHSCGKIFTGKEAMDQCTSCHGKLVRRDDDKATIIKKRLKLYQESTKPILDYYQQRKNLLEINGEQPIKKIHEDIMGQLESAL